MDGVAAKAIPQEHMPIWFISFIQKLFNVLGKLNRFMITLRPSLSTASFQLFSRFFISWMVDSKISSGQSRGHKNQAPNIVRQTAFNSSLFSQLLAISESFKFNLQSIELFKNINFKNMMEEEELPSNVNEESRMKMSRMKSKKKNTSKLSMYETNMQNFLANERFALDKINPKGLIADAVYVSFTGVIQSAQLYLQQNQDLQLSYQIIFGEEWHNQTIQSNDISGISTFCEAKEGKINFSLSFDCLLSCVYIQNWPQLVMTLKGFNNRGEIITKGYAQMHLPLESNPQVKETYIYSIHREQRWYEKLFRFLAPNPLTLEEKQFDRIIVRGEGREVEKIRSLGKIRIRSQVLKRNYEKFGYR